MTEYRVEWVVDVTAENPLNAAELAWSMIRETDTIANVFTVRGPDGEPVEVDLNDQTCGLCGLSIALADDVWVSNLDGLLCRGPDPLGVARGQHEPKSMS